jgi:hypothetical protein
MTQTKYSPEIKEKIAEIKEKIAEIKEKIAEIKKDLESGEPFSYTCNGPILIIGVNCGDEMEIFFTDKYKCVYDKLIQKKKHASRILCVIGILGMILIVIAIAGIYVTCRPGGCN